MSHRHITAAVALLTAAAAASSASAAVTPRASLDTANQTALLASRGAVVTVDAPKSSVASVALFSGGHQVSGMRHLTFRHTTHARRVLTLRGTGIELVRRCTPTKLEVRMTIRRGRHHSSVRDTRTLALDARRCPAPAQPQQPVEDHPTTSAPPADTPKKDESLFKVGTAVVDISPDKPMAVGGYGANYIVNNGVHDPLQVRAFFVGHGKQAVTFVSVDAQGWFAAYQAPNVGDGAADARGDAAAGSAARGYDVSAANVVVSATHDHAAPTIMGIWGHTDPAYLHAIKEAAVKAVLDAEAERPRRRAVVRDRHDQGPGLAGPGHRPDGRLRRRHRAADPVGARARHRRDARDVHRRADARRPVQPDQRARAPVQRRLPRLGARPPAELLGGTSVIAARHARPPGVRSARTRRTTRSPSRAASSPTR